MKCLQKSNHGFTLMEILVVVSIVAILSTIGILNWKTVVDRSKRAAVLDEVREYGNASGIARGDTGIFWRLQDLALSSMPTTDVYLRSINDPNYSNSFFVDSTLWKGPYISLQRVAGIDRKSKFDEQGNPTDLYGSRYLVALLNIETQQGSLTQTTTLMDNPNASPAERPEITMIVSWGPDQWPGKRDSGLTFDQKSTEYWIYIDEPDSDDIYYHF